MESLNFSALFFYAFALATIMLSLLVVTSKHIFRAAIYLMFVLVFTAAFYLLLGAEFLAGIQILVYVGGIIVLIVFAVMLTTALKEIETPPPASRRLLALATSGIFMGINFYALKMFPFKVVVEGGSTNLLHEDSIKYFGRKFLDMGANGFILPFEVISVLLLAAIIGGIVIAKTDDEKANV
ncbi:MAG: NADH-quinone oxidoreductase subunit J [Bacteriovoracaceae bacterium]